MTDRTLDNYLGGTLSGEAWQNAAGFFTFLLQNNLQLERGQGYWADKLYWMAKSGGEYVCFVLINGGGDETEPDGWTIWLDDSVLSCLAEPISDKRTMKTAWTHIDPCKHCGGCEHPGGSRKTLFAKEFDKVCVTPIRFDNPDCEMLECAKQLLRCKCQARQVSFS